MRSTHQHHWQQEEGKKRVWRYGRSRQQEVRCCHDNGNVFAKRWEAGKNRWWIFQMVLTVISTVIFSKIQTKAWRVGRMYSHCRGYVTVLQRTAARAGSILPLSPKWNELTLEQIELTPEWNKLTPEQDELTLEQNELTSEWSKVNRLRSEMQFTPEHKAIHPRVNCNKIRSKMNLTPEQNSEFDQLQSNNSLRIKKD